MVVLAHHEREDSGDVRPGDGTPKPAVVAVVAFSEPDYRRSRMAGVDEALTRRRLRGFAVRERRDPGERHV
jgi:hypothetical protein